MSEKKEQKNLHYVYKPEERGYKIEQTVKQLKPPKGGTGESTAAEITAITTNKKDD